jgi:hypothetical protein
VGGTPPDAFGIVVSDRHGRELLASQHARAGAHALRVTSSPHTIPRHPRAYPLRPYAGPFSHVEARGVIRRHGLEIVARHAFRARAIVSRWRVSCDRRSCRHDTAGANFPTYGAHAWIDITLDDGRRVRLAGPGGSPAPAVPLAHVAEVRVQSDPSGGYRMIPLTPRPRTELVITAPLPQWTDPLAGPTLTVQLNGGLENQARRLAVKLIPIRRHDGVV